MKNINEIVSNPVQQNQARPLTEEQKNAVGYFFARIKVIYGNQYLINFPDESTEKFAKREYARQVCGISKEKMDAGFNLLHKERQNEPEAWKFLELDKIIGLIKSGGKHWQQRVLEVKDKEVRERPALIEQKRSAESQEALDRILADLRSGLKASDMGTEKKVI